MLTMTSLGEAIAARRRFLALSQSTLAGRAKIGLSTLDALENGRLGELGFSKILRVLAALGLELGIEEARGRRPTLEELLAEQREEERHAQDMDRRR